MALMIAFEIWWGGGYKITNNLTECESFFFALEVLFGSIKCPIDEFSPL